MRLRSLMGLAGLLVGLLPSAGCDTHDHDHSHDPSGATCPDEPGAEPDDGPNPAAPRDTWESFGSTFMATYCAPCHAASLTSADRQGAPVGQDLDSLAGVLAVGAAHIDAVAGAGPLAVHAVMPPSSFSPQPTLAERQRLAEWLACGLP